MFMSIKAYIPAGRAKASSRHIALVALEGRGARAARKKGSRRQVISAERTPIPAKIQLIG